MSSRFGPTLPVAPAARSVWHEPHGGSALLKTPAPAAASPSSVSRGAPAVVVAAFVGVPPPTEGDDDDVVAPGLIAGAATLTPMPTSPFIPAAAWPRTVQRHSNLPLASFSFSVAVWFGLRSFVPLPTHAFNAAVRTALVQTLKS